MKPCKIHKVTTPEQINKLKIGDVFELRDNIYKVIQSDKRPPCKDCNLPDRLFFKFCIKLKCLKESYCFKRYSGYYQLLFEEEE